MVSNVTNLTQVRGLTDSWTFLNNVTPLFGISLVVMTFFVTFFMMKSSFEGKRAFAGSIFITFLISGLLFAMNLIPTYVLAITIVGLILSIFWLKTTQEEA